MNEINTPYKKPFNWFVFPYPILALIAFLCAGFFFDKWHPAWFVFLTIPVYYIMIAMSKAKSGKAKAYIFPYPILCMIFFLAVGFDYNLWHPAWLIFFTVPVYYTMIAAVNAKKLRSKLNIFPYPIVCVIAYLIVGFAFNWWHPAWLLFLTIPVYYIFVNSIRS